MSTTVFDQVERTGPTPRRLLDGLGMAAVLLDAPSGRILHANEVFCHTLGRGLDAVLKAGNLLPFIHPDDRRGYLGCTEKLMAGIAVRSRFDARYLRSDGSWVRMRTAQSGVRDDAGKLIWMALVLDESAEPESHSKDRSRRLAEAKITIWNWHPHSGDERAGAAFHILHGKPDGMEPRSFEEFTGQVHPDDQRAVELLLKRSRRGLSGVQDYRRLGDNAGMRWVREMVAPIKDAAGRLTHVIGVSVDITGDRSQKPGRKSEEILSFIQHLQTHWDKPLVLSAIARRYKVGTRSLQKYFSSLGTTPHDFLKRIRLVHAYDMLATPAAKTTVTKVCAKCGFGNLGHFARDYRTEFGELPSETLLRARASHRRQTIGTADSESNEPGGNF